MISVPAEDEEQAKRIAAAVTYTPVLPLWGCDDNAYHQPLGVAVWLHDDAYENPSQVCEVVDVSDKHDPARWLEPLQEFARLNANNTELDSAIAYQPNHDSLQTRTE